MERATRTLQFYFKTLYEANGLKWDSDNNAEIEDVVKNIIDAVEIPEFDEDAFILRNGLRK